MGLGTVTRTLQELQDFLAVASETVVQRTFASNSVECYYPRFQAMRADPNYQRLTQILSQWQERHQNLLHRKPMTFPSWKPALQLIESAGRLDTYAQERLAEVLARSNEELSPLRDPLGLNVGEHRWLSADREESYSDWLAWILQGLKTAETILPLFGFHDEGQISTMGTLGSVEREQEIEDGRTDIEAWFGVRGLLLIEVKTQAPGTDLTSQLKRYRHWADRQKVSERLLVLLALEEPREDITPFIFTGWQVLCCRLRNYANHLKRSDLLGAAAILIFCGAVEQNILSISAQPERFRAMASLDYLQTWREQT
jgi:hypothetical protein